MSTNCFEFHTTTVTKHNLHVQIFNYGLTSTKIWILYTLSKIYFVSNASMNYVLLFFTDFKKDVICISFAQKLVHFCFKLTSSLVQAWLYLGSSRFRAHNSQAELGAQKYWANFEPKWVIGVTLKISEFFLHLWPLQKMILDPRKKNFLI